MNIKKVEIKFILMVLFERKFMLLNKLWFFVLVIYKGVFCLKWIKFFRRDILKKERNLVVRYKFYFELGIVYSKYRNGWYILNLKFFMCVREWIFFLKIVCFGVIFLIW